MTVEQFILIYKTKKEDEKEKFINEHIVKQYVPFNEKLTYCSKIIEHSMYEKNTDNGEKLIFKQNSPVKFLFSNLSLIKLYTDLDINFDENPLSIFDALNENGLIIDIINAIPKTEYAEFQMLLDMIQDDRIMNERDLVSFIETKLNTLSLSLNSLSEILLNSINNNELEDTKEIKTDVALL